MSNSRFFVGIDLGTSNCALAFSRVASEEITLLDIPQLAQPGQVLCQKTLPSVSYLPLREEAKHCHHTLPWKEGASPFVLGAWAKTRAAELPDRVVSSAKSWLCNAQVDRLGEILPWQGECESKISPLTALQGYLEHLRYAAESEENFAEAPLDWQTLPLVLTVPASFDEVARTLTHRAAEQAGFGAVTLLEEPLAAFYSWLACNEKSWREQVSVGELILVCDLGGGTTDFSLIAVSSEEGNLRLERISVGDHLLLGGDNMDLALAYRLQGILADEQGVKLDHWQFLSLVASAREAKEKLLSDPLLSEVKVAVASRSSRLLAKTIGLSVGRDLLEEVILEGFFPVLASDEISLEGAAPSLQEFGLPFARDPAITRHLAAFLRRSRQTLAANPGLQELFARDFPQVLAADEQLLLPTAVLFNGGVFNAPLLQERIRAQLEGWSGASSQAIKLLRAHHLDLAVAHGAAYFAKHKALGSGIRVQAGTARSYYIGVEQGMMAVPGMKPLLRGLCVVPQGSEEGSSFTLSGKQFGLVTGVQSQFRFFSSALRARDTVASEVADSVAELDENSSLTITIPPLTKERPTEVVPVTLTAVISEVGTLKLFMQHSLSAQRWEVEFKVRA